MAKDPDLELLGRLSESRIYQDYERAFNEATGLPLALRPIGAWQPALRGRKHENPFCALMAAHSKSCAACLAVQEKLSQDLGSAPKTVMCFAGLCDTAVPVRVGDRLIGVLQTGQIMKKRPSRRQFARASRQLLKWGFKADLNQIEEAYFHTRVLAPKQYEAMTRLLATFGEHLSLVCNQLLVRQTNAEPPVVARARQFIAEHQSDKLSLGAVARAVNTSTFYFCKLFRKATGLRFTEYLSRVRIEKAKNLLLNPNARVSEIAYATGFQSLTHFNRVFKKVTGLSPTGYRSKLP